METNNETKREERVNKKSTLLQKLRQLKDVIKQSEQEFQGEEPLAKLDNTMGDSIKEETLSKVGKAVQAEQTAELVNSETQNEEYVEGEELKPFPEMEEEMAKAYTGFEGATRGKEETELEKKLRLMANKKADSGEENPLQKKLRLIAEERLKGTQEANNEEDATEDIAPEDETPLQQRLRELKTNMDMKAAEPVDCKVQVQISNDKMVARMFVVAPQNGGAEMTLEMLEGALAQAGVVYGIDKSKIEMILEEKKYNIMLEVAFGQPAVMGKNGEILELRPRETKKDVKLNDDGSVDFKELGIVNQIHEGDIICEILPPEEGSDGCNVLGVVLKGRAGKKILPQKGENTKFSDDQRYLIAACDGDLNYSRSGFSISKIFRVKGDVDNTIGNINFLGDVEIKGDVMEGFSINAEGNVVIGGMVEGASITAKGDIMLRKGMNGMGKGELKSEGQITSKFLENSTISSKGDIYAESIINCNVSTYKSLFVAGRRGAIIGGNITVQDSIDAKVIGAPSNVPTVINLGAMPEMHQIKNELLMEKNNLEHIIKRIKKDIEYLTIQENSNLGITPERKCKLSKLKIKEPIEKMKYQKVLEQLNEIEEISRNVSNCRLTCSTIYPGCQINIADNTKNIRNTENSCTFMYFEGEIKQLCK